MSVSRVLCIALLVISAQIPSTARNKPELAETIDLPVTYDVDFSLASKQRANLKGLRSSASSDESAKVGEEVFQGQEPDDYNIWASISLELLFHKHWSDHRRV